jgi:glycosyltransferase involved in cell wall biosynthesis
MNEGLGIVIPTLNSGRTLGRCLESINNQTVSAHDVIVVDDELTSDDTRKIALELGAELVVSEAARAESRNIGFALAKSEYLLSIDSDMILSSNLVADLLESFRRGADALTIREVGIGSGYWSRARSIDKESVERTQHGMALRAFKRSILDAVGGFDERLVAGEDLDLHQRVLETGADVRHITSSYIEHDEGSLRLSEAAKKKFGYGLTVREFEIKHGRFTLTKGYAHRLVEGVTLGWRNDPLAVPGFVILKVTEALSGFAGREVGRRRRSKRV